MTDNQNVWDSLESQPYLHGFHRVVEMLADVFEHGIDTQLFMHEIDGQKRLAVKVGGFYKNGHVTLCFVRRTYGKKTSPVEYTEVVAISHNDIETSIHSPRDLAQMNRDEWKYYQSNYPSPDSGWLPILLKYGLVTKKEQVKVIYE
jgi:hypothetical protein